MTRGRRSSRQIRQIRFLLLWKAPVFEFCLACLCPPRNFETDDVVQIVENDRLKDWSLVFAQDIFSVIKSFCVVAKFSAILFNLIMKAYYEMVFDFCYVKKTTANIIFFIKCKTFLFRMCGGIRLRIDSAFMRNLQKKKVSRVGCRWVLLDLI